MNEKHAEKFCKAFHDRIELAQKEIKNLNSFMSTDINDAYKMRVAANAGFLPQKNSSVFGNIHHYHHQQLSGRELRQFPSRSDLNESLTEENESNQFGFNQMAKFLIAKIEKIKECYFEMNDKSTNNECEVKINEEIQEPSVVMSNQDCDLYKMLNSKDLGGPRLSKIFSEAPNLQLAGNLPASNSYPNMGLKVTPAHQDIRRQSAMTNSPHAAEKNQHFNTNLPEEITLMEIILRFLQLLCENHNTELQSYLRVQPSNKKSYNLVCETLQFLDCICGSTTGGLGLLGLWINENNVHLINQALESLTEYCQGPCRENQYAIINHESNGIDIVIALILNDIQPLSSNNLEMFLALKDNASKLLLAVMESNDDTANAERILYNITPKALIDVIRDAYELGKEMDRQAALFKQHLRVQAQLQAEKRRPNESMDANSTIFNSCLSSPLVSASSSDGNCSNTSTAGSPSTSSREDTSILSTCMSLISNYSNIQNENSIYNQLADLTNLDDSAELHSEGSSPREVGHNLFILSHKLAKFNKELSVYLKSKTSNQEYSEALSYYAAHTAQIEIIREDRAIEQIVFPVPTICEYLTEETKQRIFLTTEKDEQNSKIPGFFNQVDSMWNEMKWQRKLRQQTWLYWFSSHMSLWSDISFNLAVLINLLVAIFYPFDKVTLGKQSLLSYFNLLQHLI